MTKKELFEVLNEICRAFVDNTGGMLYDLVDYADSGVQYEFDETGVKVLKQDFRGEYELWLNISDDFEDEFRERYGEDFDLKTSGYTEEKMHRYSYEALKKYIDNRDDVYIEDGGDEYGGMYGFNIVYIADKHPYQTVYNEVMDEYGDELKALCGDALFVDELDVYTCKRLNEICDDIFDMYERDAGWSRSDVCKTSESEWWRESYRPAFNNSLDIRDWMAIYKKAWSECVE